MQTGALRLRVKFPAFAGRVNEPLLSTGETGKGDLIYVAYGGVRGADFHEHARDERGDAIVAEHHVRRAAFEQLLGLGHDVLHLAADLHAADVGRAHPPHQVRILAEGLLDVVEAVESGQFMIYGVNRIEEAIELLTGVRRNNASMRASSSSISNGLVR